MAALRIPFPPRNFGVTYNAALIELRHETRDEAATRLERRLRARCFKYVRLAHAFDLTDPHFRQRRLDSQRSACLRHLRYRRRAPCCPMAPNQGSPQDDESGTVGIGEGSSMPPIIVLALGALAAGAIVHRVVKEVRRINSELDRAKTGRAIDPVSREVLRTLRRDPRSGWPPPTR